MKTENEILEGRIKSAFCADFANYWGMLAKSIGCGGCDKITTVDSDHACLTCGRMLCGHCGEYCKDHDTKKPIDN